MKIFYTDILFRVDGNDINHFASILLNYIHTENYQGFNFALDFPKMNDGQKPNHSRNLLEYYAKMGNIIRLFHPKKDNLELFLKSLLVQRFKVANIIEINGVSDAPSSEIFALYSRDLIDTHISEAKKFLRIKKFNEQRDKNYWECKLKKLEERKKSESHQKIYFSTISKSNEHRFSVVIKKAIFTKEDILIDDKKEFNVSPYGLSKGDNPIYLPMF